MQNVFVIVSLDKCCDTSVDPFCGGKPVWANFCATDIWKTPKLMNVFV